MKNIIKELRNRCQLTKAHIKVKQIAADSDGGRYLLLDVLKMHKQTMIKASLIFGSVIAAVGYFGFGCKQQYIETLADSRVVFAGWLPIVMLSLSVLITNSEKEFIVRTHSAKIFESLSVLLVLLFVAPQALAQEAGSVGKKTYDVAPARNIERAQDAALSVYPADARLALPSFSADEEDEILELVRDAQKFYTSIGRDVELNDEHWVQVGEENGDAIWQAHISSPEALTLRVFFSDFALETGSSVKVYGLNTGTGNPVAEYSETGMGDEGQFWSLIVPGDTIVIEHRVPAALNIKPKDFAFNVVRISHTFRDDQGDVYGVSFHISQQRNQGTCNYRNSVCPYSAQSATVASASSGVARYWVTDRFGSSGQCTGSLINNESGDLALYFLTAWHCIEDVVGNPEARKGTYINAEFQFDADGCAGSSILRVNGARFVAGHRRGDYALIRMERDFVGRADVVWRGWNTTIHPALTEGFIIHHANGEYQHYAEVEIQGLAYLEDFGSVSDSFSSQCSGGGCTHYTVRNTLGDTQGGSSGAPMTINGVINGVNTHGFGCQSRHSLFNQIYQDGRVEGALTYGDDYYTNTGAAFGFDDSARPSYSYSSGGGGGSGGSNPSVCNRTPQVRDEIMAEAGVFTCGQVTAARLATITYLDLQYESITQLRSDDFNGLTNLGEIDLEGNQLQTLPEDIFDGLVNLIRLTLWDNQLRSLSEDIFDGLSNLEYLDLEGNQLRTLPANIFDGLPNLDALWLNDNQLQALDEDIFDGLTELEVLRLHDNQLQSLDEDIFDGLTNIQSLSLSNNQLRTLPADIFDGLTELEVLWLYDNPFSEGLPPALIEEVKGFVESGGELYLDIVAVNGALPARLELTLGDTENVDLEDAFFFADNDAYNPASAYTVSATNESVATAELTGIHTLTITAVGTGETAVEVAGTDSDGNTAAQTLTVVVSGASICDRTQQVRDEIIEIIAETEDVVACGQVTPAHLEAITVLDLQSEGITQLQADDFNDLTNLEELDLEGNQLRTLASGIFDSLTNLSFLDLDGNPFSGGLPSAVIERLKSVADVALDFVAVNDVLPTILRLPMDAPPKELNLENAFVRIEQATYSPAESYEITVADGAVATATRTGHTLMIDTLVEDGRTEIEVVGIYRNQRATHTFAVTTDDSLIFRIKVFLEGAQ